MAMLFWYQDKHCVCVRVRICELKISEPYMNLINLISDDTEVRGFSSSHLMETARIFSGAITAHLNPKIGEGD